MKIAIAGAGAMGSRFGYMLYEAGNEVLLMDGWPEHVKAIQEKGLHVVLDSGEVNSQIPISLFSESKGGFDLIIIFSKSMQTEQVMRSCRHLINDYTYILTLQNGLGNIEVIEKYVPKNRLLAGVTTYAAELIGPGKIQALGSGDTHMMSVDGNMSTDLIRIVDVFNDANLNPKLSADVFTSIWTKVAFNAALNPLCTLANNTVAFVGSYKNIKEVVSVIIDEILLVAQAEKVRLDRDEVMDMIFSVFDPAMSGHHLPSMLQDIQNGRKTEIDYLNGAIVKKAEQYNIPVPNNRLIYHMIKMLEKTAVSTEV
ncbi:ketopantoate reductase family protein [Niallia endozanthoxylica]|uniref:2-dehydropantoate 2-reductase n=1 Tax=Niallia endozanthoxylica TaxID=2036016 RepID=A0A5J5HTG6_9BACI|nr:ketopantoate reductase family protein [Niallia endozanthoxylica]KAA9023658.1 ketopantoate reductase family protein [Niallia endozanthoxylica]